MGDLDNGWVEIHVPKLVISSLSKPRLPALPLQNANNDLVNALPSVRAQRIAEGWEPETGSGHHCTQSQVSSRKRSTNAQF